MAAAHTRKHDKLQFASLFQGTGCVAFDLLSTAFMLISNMHTPTQVDIQMQHCKTDAITLGWCSALQHSQTYEKKTGDGHPNPSLV
jgi:hypothetical protein